MPRKKKSSRTKPSAASLSQASTAQLNQELERRRADATGLAQERAQLLARVTEIDATLAELGVSTSTGRPRGRPRKDGSPVRTQAPASKTAKKPGRKPSRKGATKPAGERKRHRNDSNLVEALQKVLSGKVMGVTEVARAVQEAGYKTTSPNFRTIVNQTLIKNPQAFTKQGRGLYTSK